ncbi:hypothetical protein RclHR1_04140004 [Rhizophagus clarus]|uniref:Apple protein n=1 Tax=Rhizophagus clarus TaxID=94130 RepID=A0A2Z6SA33_9GLOM|nr:hypothetical protein RclHR1_04140004 [Rhizophagus clarus]GES80829.1 apple protein [Rhizophagus clarus]
MIKFILNSFLLLFLLGIVTASKNFDVVMGNKDFKTTNSLWAVYSQQDKDSQNGYHKAAINLKTTLPSFNPDRSGVETVICKKEGGVKKITFDLKNKEAVEEVKKWPKKVMLLISHKWDCFGKKTTQFFTATDRVIHKSKLAATFAITRCNYPCHSNDYSVDVSWVEANNNTRRSLEERFGIPFPTINLSNKIGLNTLFDAKRRKSSRPNLQITDDGDIKLLCTNCFTRGEATLALKISGKIFPPKVNEAFITLNGNFLLNIDLSLEASIGKTFSVNDFTILSIPLSPFNIPGLFNAGPSIDLVASAEAKAEIAGTLEFGADLSLPNFNVKASFKGLPNIEQSGFKPIVKSHNPKADIEATANLSASLKPQIAFGISILNGRVLRQKVGFEVVGSLDNSITFGRKNRCKRRTQPRFKSTLGGDLGFFVDDESFPIVDFPTLTLLNKCLF